MYNKVELCGVDTAGLPVLSEEEKRALLTAARAGVLRYPFPADVGWSPREVVESDPQASGTGGESHPCR